MVSVNSLLAKSNPNCTQTEGATLAKTLLQEGRPYEPTTKLDGSIGYVFNTGYIDRLVATIEAGVYESFSTSEKKLTDEYMTFQLNGSTPSDVVVALDNTVGAL